MLSVTLFKAAPHRANAIDKRAIANLRCHIETEIELDDLNINKADLLDKPTAGGKTCGKDKT